MPKSEMYVWDGTTFVPWGGTVAAAVTSGGTVSIAGTPTVSIPGTPTTNINSGTVETKPYTSVVSGELAVGTAAGGTAAGSVACHLVRFRARYSNTGTIYMGGGTTITTPDGTTDTTSGWSMVAGDDTGWMPSDNVNRYYFLSSGTGNALTYVALV